MSSNRFSAATMVAITDPMADSEKDRLLLEEYLPTSGLVSYVVAAHNEVLRVQVTPSGSAQKVREFSEKATELDALHDDCYKGLYSVLTGLLVVVEEERSAELERIRDALFPDGLSGVQNTYLAESGRVELATSRMTPEMEAILKETVVRGKTLYQMFTEWVDAGRALGELERERVRFNEKEDATAISAAEVQQARYRWIRTMNALVAVLELDGNLPEQLQTHILQPLRTAEAKQSRKRAKATASDADNSIDISAASDA